MNMNFKYITEELEMFNPVEYDDQELVNNHDAQNIMFNHKPETYDELYDLVQNRYDMNPKTPFLLDIDTSLITNMEALFQGFTQTVELDLSTWKTSNVKNMEYMFSSCKRMEKLDISSFDTSNVENMNYMFSYCKSLTDIDLSHFNTSNVETMCGMFLYCRNLNNINLSNLDFSKVNDMSEMFSECNTIKLLDFSVKVSTKDMNQIEYFAGIFNKTKIENLKISKELFKKIFGVSPKTIKII